MINCPESIIIQFQRQSELNMDFLLNPNPLPIGPTRKSNQYQYYLWKYKQDVAEELKQEKRLKQMLHKIEEDEKKKQKQLKTNHNKRAHFPGTFYDYNVEWKRRIKDKVREDQIIQEEAKEKQEAEEMCPISLPAKRDMSFLYRGPVSGWEDHFNDYIQRKAKRRQLEDEGITFHPQINERSKKIAAQISGRVEDRLIMYGEAKKMKQKQEQMMANSSQNRTTNDYSFSTSMNQRDKYDSVSSTASNTFYRLYKEGQELNKRKKEEQLREKHSFRPTLNKLPEEIEDKIMKNRKPLYYIKNSLSNNNSMEDQNSKEGKKKGDFEGFMLRNKLLLDQRKKKMMEFKEQNDEKENKEKEKCTFSPALNKKSKKMNQMTKKHNKTFQDHILSNISASFCQENSQSQSKIRENINISKVTVDYNREDTSYDDSDSLSRIVKGESSNKQTKRKYGTNHIMSNNYIVREEEEQNEGIPEILDAAGEDLFTNVEPTHKTYQTNSVNSGKVATVTQDLTGELEEDSIQKMKDVEWQAQLSEIESHLENMMARAMVHE